MYWEYNSPNRQSYILMDKKQLKWATRRGMLELDLILLPFLENQYESLSAENKSRFERLLGCQDPELFSWLMSKAIPEDPELREVVDIIIQYSRQVN